jgi:hypothetical protein
MKTQQAAEREEQQRIKNLVLNYDLHDADTDANDGDTRIFLKTRHAHGGTGTHSLNAGIERPLGRPDKSGNNRSGQRSRKLQLSDVDWYDSSSLRRGDMRNAVLRDPEKSKRRAEGRKAKLAASKVSLSKDPGM